MNFLKNKLMILSPIIVLTVVFIFGLTLVPSVHPTPEKLPVAFVNEDEGVAVPNQPPLNMGKTIEEAIEKMAKSTSASDKEPVIDWIKVGSYQKVRKGLDEQKYYAALVIPKDFSKNIASLQTPAPSSPEIRILVNQGMNMMAATTAGQIVSGVVDHVNDNVRKQLLEAWEKKGGTLTPAQVSPLLSPITKKVINVNEVGTHSANGNAPVSFVQPLWIASIAGAIILFFSIDRLTFTNRREKLIARMMQILTGAVLALFAGFGLTWIADVIGFDVPKFTDTALFLSLAFFSFFLMISAVLAWLGRLGIVIFVLLLFFGAPLLTMAPEFMSPFYRDWVYSWLPQRFLVAGLRELLFFDKEISWDSPVATLTGIAFVSMALLLTSVLKANAKQEIDSQQEQKLQ